MLLENYLFCTARKKNTDINEVNQEILNYP